MVYGGGCGFFLAWKDLGRMFGHSFPRLRFFSCLLRFCFKRYYLEHTSSTLYTRISPQWLSELRRMWPNVPWQVACQLVSGEVRALRLNRGRFIPLRLRWVKGVCVFRCNLPPALLEEWPRSLSCHCGNIGVERPPNESKHTKITLEKKLHSPLVPGFELATFRSRVRRSTNTLVFDEVSNHWLCVRPSLRIFSTFSNCWFLYLANSLLTAS